MPIIAMLPFTLFAAQVPTPEAEALGIRLARTGTFATIAPVLAAQNAEELVAEHPELDAPDQDRLRATTKRVAELQIAHVNEAFGKAYAARLSLEDLRALVAFNESGVARRFGAALPEALVATMRSVGGLDLKGDAIKAFCRETGKACPAR